MLSLLSNNCRKFTFYIESTVANEMLLSCNEAVEFFSLNVIFVGVHLSLI